MEQEKSKKRSDFIRILIYSLFFITIIAINRGTSSVSQISYLAILVIALFSSLEDTVLIMFCLLPFPRVFLISKSFVTLLPLLQLLVIVKSIRKGKITAFSKIQFMLFVCLTLYSCGVELIRYGSFSQSLEYCVMIFVMIVISSWVADDIKKKCFESFAFGTIISAIVAYYMPTVSKYTSLYFAEYNTRFQGLLSDPGEFGQYMVCAFAIVVSLYFINRHNNKKWTLVICVLSCIVCFAFIILSGTRACMIALGVVYLVLLIWMLRDKSTYMKLLGIVVFVVTILLASQISSYLFNVISVSHGGELLSSDNRLSIWQGYIQAFSSDASAIVFGAGMNCCSKYGALFNLGNPHNVFIEKMIECGIIGFCLNIGVFIGMIKRKDLNITSYSALPFYAFLSTLLVYGSVGIVLPYFLLAMLDEKENYFG